MALRALIAILCLTTPCSRALASASPVTVDAGTAPAKGRVSVNLEELWRIGGDTDAEGEFFGVIGELAVGGDGTVFILDRQLAEVKLFSSDGSYIRTIGREGEGPGEFRRPTGMVLFPDGNVGVVQMRADFITVLDPLGNPGEDLTVFEGEGRRLVFQAGQAGPNFMMSVMTQHIGEGAARLTTELTAFSPQGTPVGTYHRVERTMDFAAPVIDETENTRPLWSVDAEGNVDVVSTYGEYAVHRFTPEGRKIRVLTREYDSLKRTEEEKEDMRSRFVIRGPIDPEIVVSEDHPDIQDLYTTPEGGLWVLSSRGARSQGENVLGVWDVYDPSGRWTHEVELKGEGNPLGDGLVFAGDRLYVIRGQVSGMRSLFGGRGQKPDDDYAEPMEVICYHIPAF